VACEAPEVGCYVDGVEVDFWVGCVGGGERVGVEGYEEVGGGQGGVVVGEGEAEARGGAGYEDCGWHLGGGW